MATATGAAWGTPAADRGRCPDPRRTMGKSMGRSTINWDFHGMIPTSTGFAESMILYFTGNRLEMGNRLRDMKGLMIEFF